MADANALRPRYRLYDTNPGQKGPRPHYITGFADGCARMFTATLALFGDTQLYDQTRLGTPARGQVDVTYSKLRRRYCRVGPSKACDRAGRRALGSNVAFVTAYPRFGTNATWVEFLLAYGTLAARAMRSQ